MRETDTPRGGGRFRFNNMGPDSRIYVDSVNGRKTVPLRKKPLKKNRIYLNTPDNFYSHHPDDPRDVTSSYHRNSPNMGIYFPTDMDKRTTPMDRYFGQGNSRRGVRKAMIIGEQPSMYKLSAYRRPELPGNLFVDNLRHQNVDWRKYDKVTWNDVLESHVKDVQNQPRDYAQTRPQREAWLASIDDRVRYSKMNSPRGLPSISPRLFNNKVTTTKPPVQARYVSKDRDGNVFYLVGPSEVTKKENRPFILPEIVKPASTTPKHLDF